MIIKRLVVLQVIALAGFGSIFVLPKGDQNPPAGIEPELPEFVGNWRGKAASVSELEQSVLGADTRFSRKLYTDSRRQIYATIVLSGQEMSRSIHRAERCLRAQGWNIEESSVISIPVEPPGSAAPSLFQVTRLRNRLPAPGVQSYNLDYYWFVGSTQVTPSHVTRTWIDIKDRLLKGMNQRWAYVSVVTPFADTQAGSEAEKQADAMLQDFVRKLVPKIHKLALRTG